MVMGWGNGVVLADAVDAYQLVVQDFAPEGFDVHLLGMGGEGHVNSLFPHSAATREESALVMAVTDSPKPPAERATLTFRRLRGRIGCGCWLPARRRLRRRRRWLLVRIGMSGRPPAPRMVDTVLFLADDAAGLL